MSGELLDRVEVETGPRPQASVIWLHGLGADGHDFEPIVGELRVRPGLAIRYVFPHAPLRPVTINMGLTMRAWYDVTSLSLEREQDEAGIRASAVQVERLIEHEQERGVTSDRIVLAGFSQGGAIALHAGLRHAGKLAGLLALSAYLPLPEALEAEASPAMRLAPVLMCHGSEDPLVPVELGRAAAERLRALGHDVEWRTYPVEHAVHPREIADVARWLDARLAGDGNFSGASDV